MLRFLGIGKSNGYDNMKELDLDKKSSYNRIPGFIVVGSNLAKKKKNQPVEDWMVEISIRRHMIAREPDYSKYHIPDGTDVQLITGASRTICRIDDVWIRHIVGMTSGKQVRQLKLLDERPMVSGQYFRGRI